MKKTIVASIIAKDQEEMDKRIANVSSFAEVMQLDVMDGKFVENHSLDFDFTLPETNARFEAHLMIENPEEWIEKHCEKVEAVIVHAESCENAGDLLRKIKENGKKPGIALNPETAVEKIRDLLDIAEHALVMTVHPGKYGAEFLAETLEKVKQIREIKPDIDIEVDGGMNPENIAKASEAGANLFVSGSYIQKSENPKQAYDELKKIALKND